MKTDEFMDEAKNRLNINSDYALAKQLGLSRQAMSQYRAGKRSPDAYTCSRLADVLGINAFDIMIEIEASAEKDETRRAYWLSKAKAARQMTDRPLGNAWRAQRDSNARPLPSEGSTLSS